MRGVRFWKREDMGRSGRKWVSKHNNFNDIARMTGELYGKIFLGEAVDVGM